MTNPDGNAKTRSPELTPGVDFKKVVSEALKRVDNFIRKGDLDQAELCVNQAREIDPKNIYAYAFQERIAILKEQVHQNALAAAACKGEQATQRSESPSPKVEAKQLQKEQPRLQPTLPSITPAMPPSRPACVANTPTKPILPLKNDANLDNSRPSPKVDPVKIPMRVTTFQASVRLPVSAQQNFTDEERNIKIQRMIKVAVDAARKEIEQKQSEIRAREREEFARREGARIQEAAETARKAEEQRQIALRKKSDEQLQQKIREALQRRREHDPLLETSQSSADGVTSKSNSACPVTESASAESAMNAERRETLERYRLVLSSVWADGAVSEEEAATLDQLRQSLSISKEEHLRLEKEVQRGTYVEAFKKAWNSGTITPENASVLEELRERFQISKEEHLAIESRILWEIQPVKNRPTLLVVDDDERLLEVVSKTLNEAGFITTPLTTTDEAYAYLKDSSPDLILCDVNLETSTMGGFAFYEKVREFERLRDTPFIFLSGLSDEALVRTGKELGADDYLSKPVSEETLVATIKGKLRRYHDLKKRMN